MAVDESSAATAPEQLRALSEPLRWRIVELLVDEELCGCHLVEELAVSQPLVSHHLRVLREAGVVDAERFRYWTYYRLRPEALSTLGAHLAGLAERGSVAGRTRRPCC
jgi:ArsR family transcriptional regulator